MMLFSLLKHTRGLDVCHSHCKILLKGVQGLVWLQLALFLLLLFKGL